MYSIDYRIFPNKVWQEHVTNTKHEAMVFVLRLNDDDEYYVYDEDDNIVEFDWLRD